MRAQPRDHLRVATHLPPVRDRSCRESDGNRDADEARQSAPCQSHTRRNLAEAVSDRRHTSHCAYRPATTSWAFPAVEIYHTTRVNVLALAA